MPNMTLEDLRTSLQNFMPTWCEIETDNDGQIIIYTNCTLNENNELVEIDE